MEIHRLAPDEDGARIEKLIKVVNVSHRGHDIARCAFAQLRVSLSVNGGKAEARSTVGRGRGGKDAPREREEQE